MDRVDIISEAADADEVIYMNLIKFKGSSGRPYVFLVEGHDDVTFYDACLLRANAAARDKVATFNCKGKQSVLTLFTLIGESVELQIDDFWFFVDRDFDGLRGHDPNPRIWVTPTYSFENLLVSETTLETLLAAEYRCNDADAFTDIEAVKHCFRALLESYRQRLYFANLCVFCAKVNDIATHPHDQIITPAIGVTLTFVEFSISDERLLASMGKHAPIDRALIEGVSEAFGRLDPVSDWRGKFLFEVFVTFLDILRRDRGSKAPSLFKRKARMSFNPKTDPIRALTSASVLPPCLVSFLEAVPA